MQIISYHESRNESLKFDKFHIISFFNLHDILANMVDYIWIMHIDEKLQT